MSLSEQTITAACRFILLETGLSNANKPHTFFQLLKNFFGTMRSQDPHLFHYDIARSTLYHLDKEALKHEQAIDRLAREFMKACHALDDRLLLPASFARLIRRSQTAQEGFSDPYLTVIELPKALCAFDEQFFTADGLTIWDREYLQLLETIGPKGKEQSQQLRKKCINYDMKWDALFWLRKQDLENGVHFFHTPAFLGLAATLWEDRMR